MQVKVRTIEVGECVNPHKYLDDLELKRANGYRTLWTIARALKSLVNKYMLCDKPIVIE